MSDQFHGATLTAARLAAENADQVEAEAIRRGVTLIDNGLTDDRISQDRMADLYDAATAGVEPPLWEEQSAAQETGDREAFAEFRRRTLALGPHYPFSLSLEQGTLTHLPERTGSSVYEFCLAFSTTLNDIRFAPNNAAVPEFERLVGRSLQAFFGADTEFFRLGWPPEEAHGRPGKFRDAVRRLHELTGGEWDFRSQSGQSTGPPEQGDHGIDVVIWKPFGPHERRIGMPMLLGQCACGRDGLEDKKWAELDPVHVERELDGHISFAGVQKCLAIPHHLPHPVRWKKATAKGGIVLDRIRLTWLAETYLNSADERLRLQPHIDNLNAPPKRRRKKPATSTKPVAKKPRPSPKGAGRHSPPA